MRKGRTKGSREGRRERKVRVIYVLEMEGERGVANIWRSLQEWEQPFVSLG